MKTLKDIIFSDIKVNNNDNYLIFNEGGIGKTTQMKAAYLELINSHIDKTVPIFVDCKSLNFKSDYPLLSAILEKYCGNDCMEATHRERLEKLICNETPQNGSYKFIIFIDGINECESNKYTVLQDIDKLLKSPNNKIIISSRINEDELVSKGFKKLKVKEFTDEQIIIYLNSKGINDNGISIKLNKINPSLLKILRIPMFLKLFANTYSKHIFPDIYTTNIVRKADLLQGFLDKILEDKENQHGNKIAPEYLERKFALERYLPALAYEMSLLHSYSIHNDVLKNLRTTVFNSNYFERFESEDETIFENISSLKKINNICIVEFYLLNKSNDDYAFSHQVWQDFFCAKFYAMCIERDIIDVFEDSISISVRQFIGEIVKNENGECECDFEKITDLEKAKKSPINMFLQSHNLNSSTPLSTLQTHTLIEIMKTSRNNNITADYSNLDLKNVNFYKCKLRNSTFDNSKIYYHNFISSGHTKAVNSISISSNGKIISGSDDETIRLWDYNIGMKTGEPIKGHNGIITSVAFSPGGDKFASGSRDTTIRIWDANTSKPIGKPLIGHHACINDVIFSQNGEMIASASDDKTIRIWDANTGEQIGDPLIGHTDSVTSIVFSHTNDTLISASFDKTIRIWNLKTREPIGEPIIAHTHWITAVAISPTDDKIASGSCDKTIRIWNLKTKEPIGAPLEGHTACINAVAFSPDGRMVASGSNDKTIRIWDSNSGEPIGEPFIGHTDSVTSLAFLPAGDKLISGSCDTLIKSWDIFTAKEFTLNGGLDCINSIAINANNDTIFGISDFGSIRTWNYKNYKQTSIVFNNYNTQIITSDFSHNCKKIACFCVDEKIRIINVETSEIINCPIEFEKSEDLITCVAISSNGNNIACGNNHSKIRIYNLDEGFKTFYSIDRNIGEIKSIVFFEDGKKILSIANDNRHNIIRIWNLETKSQVGAPLWSKYGSIVHSIVVPNDGSKIICDFKDNKIEVWDYTNEQIEPELERYTKYVESFTINTEINDNHNAIFNIQDIFTDFLKSPVPFIPRPIDEKENKRIAISHNNRIIVKINNNYTMSVWNADTGKQIGQLLTGHKNSITSAIFSQDDKKIISSSKDNTIRIWDLENHTCQVIYCMITADITECNFQKSKFQVENQSEFYNIIYSNGGLVKDEFKPKPIPFEY